MRRILIYSRVAFELAITFDIEVYPVITIISVLIFIQTELRLTLYQLKLLIIFTQLTNKQYIEMECYETGGT